MYMAYGWPQVIPIESSLNTSSEKIIYLKVANALLLVVCKSHIELWCSSQHRVRLGMYKRDSESVQREGENLQALWSLDAKLIAVITSSFFLHIFKVHFTEKGIQIGGKQPSGLLLATISLVMNERLPFVQKCLSVSNLVGDTKQFLIGLSDGSVFVTSWKGEFYGVFALHVGGRKILFGTEYQNSSRNGLIPGHAIRMDSDCPHLPVTQLELALQWKLLFVIYSNGQLIQCSIGKKGLKLVEDIKAERELGSGDAVCASVAPEREILAVGTRKGVVELYSFGESASVFRTMSLIDWGYSVDDVGPVSSIAWTPDNSAFAVGWRHQGLTVWSVSGCRLMSTIRQAGISASSPVVRPHQDCKNEPLKYGTSLIAWDAYGYNLFVSEEHQSGRILSFSFAKCSTSSSYSHQVMYGADRLLIVSEDKDELKILHLNLPASYLSQNWPILHVAASDDGMFMAVSGIHGLILYDLRLKKWRMFGDVTQEQKIRCEGLLWLGKIVVICNNIDAYNTYELLFYPRYHLDKSSLLCRKALIAKPMIMDVYRDYILVTYCPFDVHVFHAVISGDLCPSNSPNLQLSTVRELSIMSAKAHPASMRFIPSQLPIRYTSKEYASSLSDQFAREPARCLILRANGDMSLLDLDDGRERELTDAVELFWVTCGNFEGKVNLLEEVSWLDYGNRGMQVWYPSAGEDAFEQEDFMQLDPELEFDREVYPLGLLSNAGVVVGVSQRMSFSTSTEFPCFEPTPRAQTILHCLLRHLLQRDKREEALKLAQLSAGKPHFSHCLEWLLFTVFDTEISRQHVNKNAVSPSENSMYPLLSKTCDLIRNFPDYHDVVVSVARKTDGRHWTDLFSAAGRSTELFEECFQQRWYRTAACYILVIARLEGPAVSQYCALRLLQATLDETLYELAGELVRFLMRSSKEYEQPPTEAEPESDILSPRFLGYFLFRSGNRKHNADSRRDSFKEPNCHVASVKNILENHASHLMLGKELSKLVAFVKGTQFDLVEYLHRERYGSARLENFSSGFELIGRKLQMDTLQCRLDAEFLLAHMCSVKFKEWIVVLATLLQRSEVLYDLFRHDQRLWKAYSLTLRSQPAFGEYHELLQDLEVKLSRLQ